MREAERLFDAIGGVDDDLLARSEKRPAGALRRRLAWIGAAAACLAVVAAAWLWTWPAPGPDPGPDPGPADVAPSVPGDSVPAPRLEGEGQYHLLDCRLDPYDDPLASPPFSIYYSEDDYYVYQPVGSYFIRPLNAIEGLPLCQLEIAHYPDATVEEAAAIRQRHDALYYETVTLAGSDSADPAVAFPDSAAPLCLQASDGTDWDDGQSDTWFIEDGRGGVFALSSQYFLEAAEGFGARFYDMICTFRVEDGQNAPAWRTALEETAQRLMEAVFDGDLDGAADLLALDESQIRCPWLGAEGVSVAQIDYSVDQPEEGEASAEVTVKCRTGPEEPYGALRLSLVWSEGGWKVCRIGGEQPGSLPPPALPEEKQ